MKFEKVSQKQYEADARSLGHDGDYWAEYDNLKVPERGTRHSACYDFYAPFGFKLNPDEEIKFPSGIRASDMPIDSVLLIFPRSSTGIKKNLMMKNTVCVIDSDYQYAENEGHIIFAMRNFGDTVQEIAAGERFAQGAFIKYLITDDDNATAKRSGGIGSTGK